MGLVGEPIQPLPTDLVVDEARFRVGEQLFRDPQLSINGEISCLSCHQFERGGADGEQYSKGIKGKLTQVNTPTVFNVAYNFRFNWDGQHETLAAHTDKLMQNPSVMANDWASIQAKLSTIDGYQQTFAALYDDGVTKDNVIDAIVTYEAALVTPNAPFDRYLKGEVSALSDLEKEGYGLFKAYGCVSCHQGANVGGNMFQKFGVIGDYFADTGSLQKADLGRFNVTGDVADRHVFRVPSLRNVAVTPPYLHDGTAETLEDAIDVMAKYQLGRSIPAEDVSLIAQFLQTLTGEYEGVPLSEQSSLPDSTHANSAEVMTDVMARL